MGILFSAKGQETFERRVINPDTHGEEFIPTRENLRFFAFCNTKCQHNFFLFKDRFNKDMLPIEKRIKSLGQVRQELQDAFLASDDDNFKDLIDVLREEI